MATVINSKKAAGFHSVEFGGSVLVNGIYFYRIQTDQFVDDDPPALALRWINVDEVRYFF